MSFYNDSIGGYFGLELPGVSNQGIPRSGLVELNSARNCLEYILEARHPTKVYVPKYTCDAILEPFQKTGVAFEFYSINLKLELVELPILKDNELILYTNYFGIKDAYIGALVGRYNTQIVIDASQAFFYNSLGNEDVFYSPRKFFGVPDGGLLITKTKLSRALATDVSNRRMSHLIKRLELPAEEGYEDFKRNDKALKGQPILSMSMLTKKILASIDYSSVRRKRRVNFLHLHEALKHTNKLDVTISEDAVPMVYPYLTDDSDSLRKRLIDNRVFIAMYWPGVLEWCKEEEVEVYLARGILPLPIDQRYDISDIDKVIEIIQCK